MSSAAAQKFHQAPLPKAVRRAARAAEKAHGQVYGNGSQEEKEPPKGEQQPFPEPPTGEQQRSAEPPTGEQQPSAEPPTGEQQPSAEPLMGEQGEQDDLEKWKQRYKSVEGRLAAKDREIESLQQSLAAITKLKEQAATQVEAAKSGDQAPAPRKQRLRQEDINAYGEDFIKVVKDAAADVAASEFMPEIERLRQENEKLREQFGSVEQRTAKSDQARVTDFLNANVPDWQQINTDPEFLEWLKQTDPMSGESRQALLDRAGAALDERRIAHFFKAYQTESQAIRSHQKAEPPAPTLQQQAPAQARTPIVDATQMVAPGRPSPTSGSGAGAASERETPPVTESFIAAFYNDAAMGKYKQRQKEYQQIQARIQKALAEGTVVRDVRHR
jgi:hypothetical protein